MVLQIILHRRVKPLRVVDPDDSGNGNSIVSFSDEVLKVETFGCFLCYDKIRVLLDVISSLLIQVLDF